VLAEAVERLVGALGGVVLLHAHVPLLGVAKTIRMVRAVIPMNSSKVTVVRNSGSSCR
jgi:hypothetical protein